MTDSVIKYVGVDGCTGGWVGVGLDDDGGSAVKVCKDFCDVLEHFKDACVILVDMPMGLLEDGKSGDRVCDKEARKLSKVKRFKSSVFPAPTKRLLDKVIANEWEREDASEWSCKKWGRKINAQEFGIFRKIHQVKESLLSCGQTFAPKVREAHPEVCFWALNGGKSDSAMVSPKKTGAGFWERFKTLRRCVGNVDTIVDVFMKVRPNYPKGKVADDDVLDALALAITAKLGCENGFRRLPKDLSPDRKKPPEMVYVIPPKGTPC